MKSIDFVYKIILKCRKQLNLSNTYEVKTSLGLDCMHQINMKTLTTYF